LSAKLMANRSDRHLVNLPNCQGTKARSPDQEKVRGFPSWPRSVMRCSFKTRPQPEDQSKAATLRTGLGPYTRVRNPGATPFRWTVLGLRLNFLFAESFRN
jgi:hypothetical protein